MATPFRLKRSAISGKRPTLNDLQLGELALNTYDAYLYGTRDAGGVGIGTTVTLLTPWTENFGAASIYYENVVGVGTTNPTSKFTVQGDVLITGFSTVRSNFTVAGVTTTQHLRVTGFTTTVNQSITGVATIGTLAVSGVTTSRHLNVAGVATFNQAKLGVVTSYDLIANGDYSNTINLGNDLFIYHISDPLYRANFIHSDEYNLVLGNKSETGGNTSFNVLVGIFTGNDAFSNNTSYVSLNYGNSDTKLNTIGAGVTVFGTAFTNQLNVSGVSTLGTGVTITSGGNINAVSGVITATQFVTGAGAGITITNNTIFAPTLLVLDPSPAGVGTTSGVVQIKGDLYVDGTQFVVNSTTIELGDFNIGIATTVGTNALLDGAGLGIGSVSIRKNFTYASGSDSLKSSENFDLASGKVYKINGTEVLSATQLTVANINAVGVSTLGTLAVSGVTTTQHLNVTGFTTVVNQSITGVLTVTNGIQGIGIQSAGSNIATGLITAINFVGAGNSFSYNSGTKTVDINIGGSQWTFVDPGSPTTSSIYRVNGNVGIGTTNPTSKLHLVGDALITGVSTFTGLVDANGGAEIDNIRIGVANDNTIDTSTGNLTLDSNGGQVIVNDQLAVNGSVYLRDNDTLNFGTQPDLYIYHNGSNSFIQEVGTGNLYLTSDGSEITLAKGNVSEYMARFITDGAVELYYDNVKEFETTGYGATVFGVLQTQGLNVSGFTTVVNQSITGVATVGSNLAVAGVTTTQHLNVTGFTTVVNQSITGVATVGSNLVVAGVTTTQHLNVTGFTTVVNQSITGVATIGTLAVSGVTTTRHLNVIGFTTVVNQSITGVATVGSNLAVAGVTTTQHLNVTGFTTVVNQSITGVASVGSNLGVAGVTTTQHLNVVGFTTVVNQSITGVATVGSNLTVVGVTSTQHLNVSGIATINRVSITTEFNVYAPVATFHNDINIIGNVSIGGTTVVLNAAQLQIKDKDIILGITTNALGNDVSTDTSANHGGIAIASTEGTPLINIDVVGIDSIPNTYKQIMWLRSGTLTGLSTDAWLFNYGVGIGSTQIPNGVRLAVGSVQFTQNDLAVVRSINASGFITATTFNGQVNAGVGTITTLSGTNLNYSGVGTITTLNVTTANLTNANILSGIVTTLSGTNINYSGVGTIATLNSTTANLTTANLTNANILSGIVTTLSGTNINYSGVGTIATLNSTSANLTNINSSGITTVGFLTATNISVSGIVTSNGYYIAGTQVISSARQLQNIASLDTTTTATIEAAIANAPNIFTDLTVTGISTLGVTSATNLTAQQLNITGVSTISVNSSSDALRITQTGSGNALVVEDSTNPDATPFVIDSIGRVGIGTTLVGTKLYVRDENQNSNTYSSEVYRTSTNFSSGVGHRAYYESYYTTAGVQTSYASGINAQVSASVAAGSTNNGYIRAGLDAAWRNNANAQSSTDNGTLAYLYGRGISYGHFNDNAVSPITNTATGLYLTPYCLTGSIGTLIGLDINSVSTAVGATATNVRGINCEIDTTNGTNPYNLYISGNAKNYIAGSVGIGTTIPGAKLNVVDNSSSDALRITQTGSGNALVVEDSTNPDATRFVILPDGKVGVGTTGLIQYSSGVNDTSTFGILAPTGNDSAFVLKGNNGSTTDGSGQTLALLVGSTGGTGSGTIITHLSHDTSGIGTRRNAIRFTDNQIRFEDNVSGSVDVTINSSGSGELLVGTTTSTGTASQALQVSGGAYIAGDTVNGVGLGIGVTNPIYPLDLRLNGLTVNSPTIRIYPTTTTRPAGIFYVNASSSNFYTGLLNSSGNIGAISGLTPYAAVVGGDAGTTPLLLVTNALERVRIFDTGEVGIGTTVLTGTASQPLQVAGGAYVSGSVGIGTTNPTSKLTVQGNAYITGVTTSTDFDSLSDINLKTNINQISNPLEKVMQIRGVTFDWKETNRGSAGVIAQEIEKVLPELVHGGETKTVNYNGLIGLLIECVKKQQEEIEQLKKLN